MSAKYDSAHKAWKQSGFHDEFETIPFANFTSNQWVIYLHELLEEHPGLLKVVTADLDEAAFFESTTGVSNQEEGSSNQSQSNTVRGRRRRKRKAPVKRSTKESRDDIFRQIAESNAKSAFANEAKSKAVSYSALLIRRDTAQRGLDTAKQQKNGAMKALKRHEFTRGSPSRARKIVKTVKNKVDPSPAKSDTSEPLIYSQSTTASIRALGSFDTVHQHASDIVDANKAIKTCNEELEHLKREMNTIREK